MVIQVVSLFPDMMRAVWNTSILKRAQSRHLVDLRVVPLRWFGLGPHRQADDYPFGGGPGMLLRPDVVVPAVEWAMMHHRQPAQVVLTSAQGKPFTQELARKWAQSPHLIIVAGHYEGIDDRVRQILNAEEVSIGDYVLTGGELPALVMVDAVVRLIPGVLGSGQGAADDSFSIGPGLLEGPQFTRPEVYRGLSVPDVLLSGHHQAIRQWRQQVAWEWTRDRRPDLLPTHSERREEDL
ncbi:tRNA (guanine-N1)-methyltransferase [Sulfobacillus acidophilus TPY]|uniref:tRNA (guanine-N(1)-)-methyltransferase n=1 Tax=Sulfobacillus acidophilus (strain ATCC 700253 / DSM 10332 / NAL) TaxID=679936 RepID=G8TVG3_SULAD|nr:tRNA (guanine-N1)-methyltransferase [Sulfobacillus acidophilus TPY]AEW05882.1 tRNA (Guanine37-N(1)-) methyltransferase [Sulfobacillus acidophilus DSM 10332]